MAQQAENRKYRGEWRKLLPKASTAISSGDVVVLGDKSEEKGLGNYKRGLTNARIEPMSDDDQNQFVVGICDMNWTSTSDDYASPVINVSDLVTFTSGVFRLAIVDTSGNVGDKVVYSSGATGAQLFTIDNERPEYAVGEIWRTFSGASANDVQEVLFYNRFVDRSNDVYMSLENHVVYGGWVRPLNAGATTSSVSVGGGADDIVFRVKGRILRIVEDATLAMPNPPGGSTIQVYKIVARSGGVAIGTATARAVASWTATTIGDFPALTSGEALLAYVRAFSASDYSLTSIFNIRGVHDIDNMDSVHNGL